MSIFFVLFFFCLFCIGFFFFFFSADFAIRNQRGAIISLTSCVGKAYSGSASLLQDLVQDVVSLLLIGPGWKNNNFQVSLSFIYI